MFERQQSTNNFRAMPDYTRAHKRAPEDAL